jgi:ferrous iron transport protein B
MEIKRLALIGNPNTGKSSVFNLLTGLRQHVGNFPGVTVDKKTGTFFLEANRQLSVIDLPGTYSIFPRSADEKVVFDVVNNPSHPDFPDLFLVVVDVDNLQRNLLLYSQLNDLGLPMILLLTMEDQLQNRNAKVNVELLTQRLGNTPVVLINGRTGKGLDDLKAAIKNYTFKPSTLIFSDNKIHEVASNPDLQVEDAEVRYEKISPFIKDVIVVEKKDKKNQSSANALDKVFVHPVFGYLIFLALLMVIFQFIYRFASVPMDLIDEGFLNFSQWTKSALPDGVFTNLLAEGIVPGIGGVVVFVPQIAMLFFFLSILEETGYMSRVVFLMDRLVRPFGLNGKSVVPLMSSVACAIPGIMATRNISSWKDRIITIMVAPLMSCSARIPVYTLLIALVIPNENVFGIFNLQGLVLLGLYLLGLVSALLIAAILKYIIKTKELSYLIMEMPGYKLPRWKYVFIHLWEKVKVFVVDAGKVILSISIILWALASYGPGNDMDNAEQQVLTTLPLDTSEEEKEKIVGSVRLENSFIGKLGKGIEPVIAPLGYDWKIGIALITSFAAREVFVGSMATIYSVGEDFDDDKVLLDRLKDEKRRDNGLPVYSLATGVSLMIFYVYAMQCMATFAVVYRETKSWKWPLIQLFYMAVMAYLAALIVYRLLS